MSRRGPANTERRRVRGRRGKWILGAIGVAIGVLIARAAHDAVNRRRLAERVRQAYVAAECTVISKDVRTSMHTGRAHGRDRHRDTHAVFEPVIRYRYRVAGRVLESDRFSVHPPSEHERDRIEQLLGRYEAGGTCTCWYDPDTPEDAVLDNR